MAHDVFISYSTKDKPIADAICAHLEGAGVRCWISPRDIEPGEDWPKAISNAISQSQAMVLVFSSHSNSSEDVSRELNLAANNKLIIIPFKIENVEPEPGIKYYLSRTHWLDAMNPPTEEQIRLLTERVIKILSPENEAEQSVKTAPPAPPKAVQSPAKRKFNPWLIGVAILFLLVVGIVLCGGGLWLGRNLYLAKPASNTPRLNNPTAPSETLQITATPIMEFTETSPAPLDSPQPITQEPAAPSVSLEIKRIAYYETEIRKLAWMPDNKQIILAGFELQPYDIVSLTATKPISQRILDDVAISPDGNKFAVATTWEGIQLFDRNWGNLGTLPMSSDGHSLTFTPDGKKILAGVGNLIKIWDTSNNQELQPIPLSDRVNGLALSPDGSTLAASILMDIKLLDIKGEDLFTLKGHGHQIFALAFSPDGKTLASGSLDDTIRLWNVSTGRLLRILNGHTKTVNSVAFSPDGKLLASGSDDTTAKVWDVSSGTVLQTLYDHTEAVTSVAFSVDGKMLATGSYDKLQLWNITIKSP
jgi:hypothetical protein